MALAPMAAAAEDTDMQTTTTLRIYDEVVFYDGYNDNVFDAGLDDGILRHRNSLYAIKLTDEQMDAFGDHTDMNITIGALCDNYDRIGNINIAFVPKGRESYVAESDPLADNYDPTVQRVEIGRFITPFMNMNKDPKSVPYSYTLDNLGLLMHDTNMRARYDYWLEFELFGIPYAANEQIAGCANRNDVFTGTLEFVTTTPAAEANTTDIFIPIKMKLPEYNGHYNLNNYRETATDELGKTIKSYYFTLDQDIADGMLCLITSNHGANSGGEEYNRRDHYVYIDDELVLTYKPGRTSCEPFRKYNTQANGIYGYFKKNDETWQSFSNWCPGDVIDNRFIRMGAVSQGTHKVTISVPDAVFNGGQGDIPVSLYFQGVTEGALPEMSGINEPTMDAAIDFAVSNGIVTFATTDATALGIELRDVAGRLLDAQWATGISSYDASAQPKGVYLLNVVLDNGYTVTHKFAN